MTITPFPNDTDAAALMSQITALLAQQSRVSSTAHAPAIAAQVIALQTALCLHWLDTGRVTAAQMLAGFPTPNVPRDSASAQMRSDLTSLQSRQAVISSTAHKPFLAARVDQIQRELILHYIAIGALLPSSIQSTLS